MNTNNKFCLICKADITSALSVRITHQIERSTTNLTLYQFLQTITDFNHLDITKVSQLVCQKCCMQIFTFYDFQLQCNKAAGNLEKAEKMNNLSLTKIVITTYIPDPTELNDAQFAEMVITQENEKTEEVFAESFPDITTTLADEKNAGSDDDWFHPIVNEKELTAEEKMELRKKYRHRKAACNVCKKMIVARNMKQHMLTHMRKKPYKCEKCIHGPHSCTVCRASFTKLSALTQHMYTHKQSYSCKMCGRKFAFQWTCESHEKTHLQGGKAYPCDECPKVFNDSAALKYHMFSHQNRRSFECAACGKRYHRPCLLKAHQLKTCPGKRIEIADIDPNNVDLLSVIGEGSNS